MDEASTDDTRVHPKSVVASVAEPLVGARKWVLLVGLGGVLAGLAGCYGSLVTYSYSAEQPEFFDEGWTILLLVLQLGWSAFTFWVGVLLCQAAGLLRKTGESSSPGTFKLALQKLRVYFMVQGSLVLLGVIAVGVGFLFGGLSALLDL